MFRENEKGQVLLAIVLVMIVGLTVGLSLASRSIVNLRTSTEEINSQQALAAAEAGIEQVSKTSASIANGSFSNNSTYSTDITSVSGNSFLMNGGNVILKDDSADVWLSDYSSDVTKIYQNQWSGTLGIYWGKGVDGCSQAALEVIVLSGNKSNPVSTRYAFDPCLARSNANHFTFVSSGGSVSGTNFPFGTTINVNSGLLARIIPLYQNASVGLTGNIALPAQGNLITSVGNSGNASRKLTLFQGFPTLPSEYFPYGLFSP